MGRRICLFGALAGVVMIGVGLLLAFRFIPPLAPSVTAAQTVAYYSNHIVGVRAGAILWFVGVSLTLLLYLAISDAMMEMSHRSRLAASAQIACAVTATVPALICALIFAALSVRPDRVPELTQLLSDIGWLTLVMPAFPISMQLAAIAFATLADRSDNPIFPRWSGYLSGWAAVLLLPGTLVPLFSTGPFAWNGVLTFYLGLASFSIWFGVMCWVVWRSTTRPT
jgi:hypothetical protein